MPFPFAFAWLNANKVVKHTNMLGCLTALLALSHVNEKGKDIDSKGWAFRML